MQAEIDQRFRGNLAALAARKPKIGEHFRTKEYRENIRLSLRTNEQYLRAPECGRHETRRALSDGGCVAERILRTLPRGIRIRTTQACDGGLL
jgi:hypothetical protein